MKQYFTYLNGAQAGPFSFEELKTKNIYRDTLVWFEGLVEWQKAGTVEELNSLFSIVPPPLPVIDANKPPAPPEFTYRQQIYEHPVEQSSSSNKGRFLTLIVVAIALFIGITAFSAYQNDQQEKHDLELRIAEQEQQVREARIREIKNELQASLRNLENAKINLHDVSAFKLLRTSSERHEQISEAEEIVTSWQKHVNELERELGSLNR